MASKKTNTNVIKPSELVNPRFFVSQKKRDDQINGVENELLDQIRVLNINYQDQQKKLDAERKVADNKPNVLNKETESTYKAQVNSANETAQKAIEASNVKIAKGKESSKIKRDKLNASKKKNVAYNQNLRKKEESTYLAAKNAETERFAEVNQRLNSKLDASNTKFKQQLETVRGEYDGQIRDLQNQLDTLNKNYKREVDKLNRDYRISLSEYDRQEKELNNILAIKTTQILQSISTCSSQSQIKDYKKQIQALEKQNKVDIESITNKKVQAKVTLDQKVQDLYNNLCHQVVKLETEINRLDIMEDYDILVVANADKKEKNDLAYEKLDETKTNEINLLRLDLAYKFNVHQIDNADNLKNSQIDHEHNTISANFRVLQEKEKANKVNAKLVCSAKIKEADINKKIARAETLKNQSLDIEKLNYLAANNKLDLTHNVITTKLQACNIYHTCINQAEQEMYTYRKERYEEELKQSIKRAEDEFRVSKQAMLLMKKTQKEETEELLRQNNAMHTREIELLENLLADQQASGNKQGADYIGSAIESSEAVCEQTVYDIVSYDKEAMNRYDQEIADFRANTDNTISKLRQHATTMTKAMDELCARAVARQNALQNTTEKTIANLNEKLMLEKQELLDNHNAYVSKTENDFANYKQQELANLEVYKESINDLINKNQEEAKANIDKILDSVIQDKEKLDQYGADLDKELAEAQQVNTVLITKTEEKAAKDKETQKLAFEKNEEFMNSQTDKAGELKTTALSNLEILQHKTLKKLLKSYLYEEDKRWWELEK